ncbi:hypothetical protein C8F01DRAFT_1122244 [Mycena amicta]|nr:hypothetical protein C8F01DRAFT_1122244 [Mycena amicta]
MTLFTVFLCLPFMFREIDRNSTCRSFSITQAIASTLLFGSFDLMLMLRVWILYGRTRRMAYIFFSMLFVEVVSMLGIILRPESYLHEFIHLGPVLQGCYFSSAVMNLTHFAFYAIPPLIVTFAMFYLTVKKCVESLRLENIPTSRRLQGSFVDKPIIVLFLRDGILWFVVVFTFYGTELIVWAVGRSTQFQVLIIPSLALFSLISSRVLLNTRSLATQPPTDGTDTEEDPDEEQQGLLGWKRWSSSRNTPSIS